MKWHLAVTSDKRTESFGREGKVLEPGSSGSHGRPGRLKKGSLLLLVNLSGGGQAHS